MTRNRNGAGTIVRRGSRYQAQISLPGGRRRTESFATERDAQAWLTEQHHLINRGAAPRPGRAPTVEQWVARWLESLSVTTDAGQQRGAVRPSTYRSYAAYTRRDIVPALGRFRLD